MGDSQVAEPDLHRRLTERYVNVILRPGSENADFRYPTQPFRLVEI